MSRRFRWTRKRYYQAQHLDRLLPLLPSITEPPPLVQRLHELIRRTPGVHGRDPLERSVRLRLIDRRNEDDGIPF